jgi:hypothetical protein
MPSTNRQEVEKALLDKKSNLLKNLADDAQRMHMLKTCITPALVYGFGVCAYTPAQLKALNSKVMAIAKRCYRIQQGTPNAAIQLPINEGGLDVPSLMTQYAAKAVEDLIKCLADQGQLGLVTKCLLLKQSQHVMPGLPFEVAWGLTRE